MSDDLPYLVEYAKSGRASCKACKSSISKDNLRLATLVQSPFHDGKMTNWFHPKCFFQKQRPKTVGDIAHFDNIRMEDQQFIKNKIAESASLPELPAKGKKRGKASASAYKDFKVEYAKSNRSKCIGCQETIVKDEVRISKKDFESDDARKYGGLDRWHHVDCFVKLRDELQFFDSGDALPGAKDLSAEDQKMLKSKVPKSKAADMPPVKKAKIDPEDAAKEAKMAKQNKKMFSYRDKLADVPKAQLTELLEYNGQRVPIGVSCIQDLLADIMTFGALKPCEKCGGQLSYVSGTGYKCTGSLDEWTKCENLVQNPDRKKFKAPSDLKEVYSFLKDKFKIEERLFNVIVPSVSKAVKKEEDTTDGPKVAPLGPKPLKHMEFFLAGRLKKDKDELKRNILLLGGSVAVKLHENVAAVISNEAEVKKMSKKIAEAQDLDIQVVSEDFVDEAKDFVGAPVMLINKKNICEWGADPSTRISKTMEKSMMKSKSGKSQYQKSVSGKQKIRIKGGGAVDPDSGLEDIAHVYQRGKDKYTVTLGITDIQKNKNSYYKLQILKDDKKEKYWLFRSWGRIGTTIGNSKLEKLALEDCIEQFEFLYHEKSGNRWEYRDSFKKVAGCMYPMDIDEGVEDVPVDLVHSNVESKLKKPVQDLIQLIFDEKLMKKAMLEMEIDVEKMPLGKLSKKQIQNAFEVLTELQRMIKSGNPERTRLIGATNRFYTLVPHDFGVNDPKIIDTEEMIDAKNQMLESLMEMEIAYSLLHGKVDSSIHPLDAHYEQLHTDIDVLERDSEEFQLIQQYVKNTHAATHSTYELEIEDVFKIKRQGEEKRYKPFKKLPNRKLLWHGSRVTNYVGILSQGLRIAPPEAPVTGYMFGKGIYFADMVSKSANYCCTSATNPTGLMMLCEVALGNMYERYQSDYIEKLPTGKHSTFGRGATQPDPKKSHITASGVEIPLGSGVDSNLKKTSALLYNEYIVYDVAQAKIDYLVRMKFNYKF